jgi:hypothetical protein
MTPDDRDDVMNELERMLGRIEPSAGFHAGVKSRIEAGRRKPRVRAWWWMGAMAAAALIALIVIPFRAGRRPARIEVANSAIPTPAARAASVARASVEVEKQASPRSGSARRVEQLSAAPRKPDRNMAAPRPLVPPDRAIAIARLIAFVHAGMSLGDVPGPSPDVDVKPLDPIPVIDIAPIKVPTLEATVAASPQGESQ